MEEYEHYSSNPSKEPFAIRCTYENESGTKTKIVDWHLDSHAIPVISMTNISRNLNSCNTKTAMKWTRLPV